MECDRFQVEPSLKNFFAEIICYFCYLILIASTLPVGYKHKVGSIG